MVIELDSHRKELGGKRWT